MTDAARPPLKNCPGKTPCAADRLTRRINRAIRRSKTKLTREDIDRRLAECRGCSRFTGRGCQMFPPRRSGYDCKAWVLGLVGADDDCVGCPAGGWA